MAPRKTTSVDKVYSYGRSFPQGRVRDEQAEHRVRHDPSPDVAHAPVHSDHRTYDPHVDGVDLGRDTFDQTHPAYQKPQDRESQQAPTYDNDTPNGWLRGGGADGGMKPTFDRSPPRNRMRR